MDYRLHRGAFLHDLVDGDYAELGMWGLEICAIEHSTEFV
jgi:hypothetical protein